MTISLPCGRGCVALRVAEEARPRVAVLASHHAPPLPDPAAAAAGALGAPHGAQPLATLARGKRSACVVVSDLTRPVPNQVLLPPILAALAAAGMAREAITLLIATGMHRPTSGAEQIELLGEEIAATYRVVNHDCRDRSVLRRVDTIEGTPIELNRHYLDADLKILTGLIEPHPFAGFSGGGKSVLPGVASFGSMTYMHSYALLDRPGVAAGRVAGNPFREQVDRVCGAAGEAFLVNVTIDRERRLTGVFAGDVGAAFRAGCVAAAEQQVVAVEAPADVVVTTGGGYPLDQTFYQASKGLVAARNLVRPGGTVLLVAGCAEGLGGPDFCEVVRSSGSPAGFRERHADPRHFATDQWTAQAFFRTLEHAGKALLYAPGLGGREVASFGLERVDDLDAAVAGALDAVETAYVVPEGPYVTARVAGSH